jgi:hypothetical protein
MPRAGVFIAIVTLAASRLAAAEPLAIHIHSEQAMFQVLISPKSMDKTTGNPLP